jgi:hypothetical protein
LKVPDYSPDFIEPYAGGELNPFTKLFLGKFNLDDRLFVRSKQTLGKRPAEESSLKPLQALEKD